MAGIVNHGTRSKVLIIIRNVFIKCQYIYTIIIQIMILQKLSISNVIIVTSTVQNYFFDVHFNMNRQWRRARGVGGTITEAAISSCKCISTTPIGAPIYILPRVAITPAPPLLREIITHIVNDSFSTSAFYFD